MNNYLIAVLAGLTLLGCSQNVTPSVYALAVKTCESYGGLKWCRLDYKRGFILTSSCNDGTILEQRNLGDLE